MKKMSEAIAAICPIMAVVVLLSLTIAPMPTGVLLAFLFGGAVMIVGMMFFSLGAELAMETMGEQLGTSITKTRKLWLILALGFLLGVLITISEPDLQVLANQISSIPNSILIISIAIGVGLFLVIAFLRMVIGIPLRTLLFVFYGAVILLSLFVPKEFLAVAFDSGGVTTGPMTVPFIMSFGIGIAAIRNDKHAADDSFGLIALCSIGPILAIMVLGLIYGANGLSYAENWIPEISQSTELGSLIISGFPKYLKEMAISLLPIVGFFGVFQLFSKRLVKKELIRIGIGLVYTYIGLVLFLTGVNAGFLPAGTYLGEQIAGMSYEWIIIPIGMLIGFFIVKAEPAIYVLMHQVEELTNGMIKGKALQTSLCISVAASIGLSMLRVICGIPILWFVIPGYLLALGLSIFAPKIFTAIAFDSGGVASGPMTTTFLLPFAMGASIAVGGNVITDAFGIVAMVALTPLITIQILGIVYKIKDKSKSANASNINANAPASDADNYVIIDL